MKKLLMLIAMVVMGFLAMAQTNPISYQAVVRDANNRLAADSTVDVTVQILKSDNSMQFEQVFTGVKTNSNGLLSLLINGTGLSSVNWEGAKFYTNIVLGSLEMKDTVPVTAVPYALHGGLTPSDSAKIKEWIADTLQNYYTKGEIKDTLKAYYTAQKVNDTLSKYYTSYVVDTLLAAKADTSFVNLINKQVLANTQAIKDTANQIRKWADTTFATVAKVQADSIVLHKALKDTALAIRTWTDTTFVKVDDVKKDTLILMSGVDPLDTFVSNAGAAPVVVDIKSRFTHTEEVDSVKNFINTLSKDDALTILGILSKQSDPAQVWTPVRDSIAGFVMDYLKEEMMKDTTNMTLVKRAIDRFAVIAPTLGKDDAKYYLDRAKEIRNLIPSTVKEDIKNELKYRIKNYVNSTEFMNEVKNVLTDATFQSKMATLLTDATVQNAILTNSGVQAIVKQLIIDNVNPAGFTATDVQTAINNAIVNAMGGSAGQSINDAIKNVLPGSVTIQDIGTKTLTW